MTIRLAERALELWQSLSPQGQRAAIKRLGHYEYARFLGVYDKDNRFSMEEARDLGRMIRAGEITANSIGQPLSMQPPTLTPASDEGTTVTRDGSDTIVTYAGPNAISTVEELAAAAGIEGLLNTKYSGEARAWTTAMKVRRQAGETESGAPRFVDEPAVVQNHAVSVRFSRLSGDEMPINIGPVTIKPRTQMPPKSRQDDVELLVVWPDMQIGYFREDWTGNVLAPTHDVRAIDCALSLVSYLQPDHIVDVGDSIDNPEFSKYDVPAELRGTTNVSLATGFWVYHQMRGMCPTSSITVVDGNHGFNRLIRHGHTHTHDIHNIRVVGDELPALHPVRLMRFDELNVEYHGPYGEVDPLNFWGEHGLDIKHGDKVRAKPGGTVSASISNAQRSTTFGHIHRAESCSKRVHGVDGVDRLITVWSNGCLCRVDNAVPNASKTRLQDWQQGIGLVWYSKKFKRIVGVEHVMIEKGVAVYDGRVFEGDNVSADVADFTGVDAIGRWEG